MTEQASNLGRTGFDVPPLPVCGYSPVPSDPTVRLCGRPAAVHVLPEDRGAEAAWTIMACELHAPLATPDALDWHPWTTACQAPRRRWIRGSAWRLSGCAIPKVRAAV